MPVCIETCEKNISIISTAVIKENRKCNGLQRKGQWPRPSSEAVCTKLVRSELNCLKAACSLQHWRCKGAQLEVCGSLGWQRPLCRAAPAAGGTLNSLSCKAFTPHVWELSQWEKQKQTNKQTVIRRETEKRRCHSAQHLSQDDGWKTKELSPLSLF